MSMYNVLSLVVVIVAQYDIVKYACVWQNMGSSARAVWQGEGDLGIGEPALLVVPKNASLTAPHEPQGLGGRIYRLPPLPPTPSFFVVLCCAVLPS